MAEFPAIPLWTDALLADTGHLDDAEIGRYVRLLIVMWRSPDCRIPNDVAWISKRMRVQPLEYASLIAPLVDEFCITDGNYLSQKRLLKEFHFVRKMSKDQSARALKRWRKVREEKEEKNQTVSDIPMKELDLGLCPSYAPTPTPTPTSKDTGVSLPPTPKKAEALPDGIPQKEFTDFEEHRKKIRKPLTPKARALAISRLQSLQAEGHNPAEVLNQSIMNGWTGLFETKGHHNGNSSSQPAQRPNGQRHQPKASYMDKIASAGEKALGLVKARMDADSRSPWNDQEPATAGGHLSDLSGEREEKPDGN